MVSHNLRSVAIYNKIFFFKFSTSVHIFLFLVLSMRNRMGKRCFHLNKNYSELYDVPHQDIVFFPTRLSKLEVPMHCMGCAPV
jgi:hypothetical protein